MRFTINTRGLVTILLLPLLMHQPAAAASLFVLDAVPSKQPATIAYGGGVIDLATLEQGVISTLNAALTGAASDGAVEAASPLETQIPKRLQQEAAKLFRATNGWIYAAINGAFYSGREVAVRLRGGATNVTEGERSTNLQVVASFALRDAFVWRIGATPTTTDSAEKRYAEAHLRNRLDWYPIDSEPLGEIALNARPRSAQTQRLLGPGWFLEVLKDKLRAIPLDARWLPPHDTLRPLEAALSGLTPLVRARKLEQAATAGGDAHAAVLWGRDLSASENTDDRKRGEALLENAAQSGMRSALSAYAEALLENPGLHTNAATLAKARVLLSLAGQMDDLEARANAILITAKADGAKHPAELIADRRLFWRAQEGALSNIWNAYPSSPAVALAFGKLSLMEGEALRPSRLSPEIGVCYSYAAPSLNECFGKAYRWLAEAAHLGSAEGALLAARAELLGCGTLPFRDAASNRLAHLHSFARTNSLVVNGRAVAPAIEKELQAVKEADALVTPPPGWVQGDSRDWWPKGKGRVGHAFCRDSETIQTTLISVEERELGDREQNYNPLSLATDIPFRSSEDYDRQRATEKNNGTESMRYWWDFSKTTANWDKDWSTIIEKPYPIPCSNGHNGIIFVFRNDSPDNPDKFGPLGLGLRAVGFRRVDRTRFVAVQYFNRDRQYETVLEKWKSSKPFFEKCVSQYGDKQVTMRSNPLSPY